MVPVIPQCLGRGARCIRGFWPCEFRPRLLVIGGLVAGVGCTYWWLAGQRISTQLLTTFYATGQVDTSRYTPNVVSFATPQS